MSTKVGGCACQKFISKDEFAFMFDSALNFLQKF